MAIELPPLRQQYIVDHGKGLATLREIEQSTRGVGRATRDTASKGKNAWSEYGKGAELAYKGVQRFGRYLKNTLYGVVLSVTLAMAQGTRTMGQWRRGLAEVSTLVDTSAVSMGVLEKQLLNVARNAPVQIDALTKALYQTISAGVDASEAVGLVDTAARAAVGGVTTVDTAVDGLTNTLNAWGLAASEATNVADAFFVAVRNGKTTFGELASSIGQAAPLAAQLQVRYEDLLAAVAALTTGGISTSEAMTQVRSILTAVTKTTSEAEKQAEKLGIRFDATALQANGLQGFLNMVAEAADGDEAALADLFGRVEGLQAVLALTGSQSESFTRNLRDMETRAGTTAAAFAKMRTEAGNTWQAIKNRLTVAFMDFASRVLPSVNREMQKFLRFMRLAEDPSETLLESLRRSGASADVIATLQVDIDRRNLEDRKKEIEETLSQTTIRPNVHVEKALVQEQMLAVPGKSNLGIRQGYREIGEEAMAAAMSIEQLEEARAKLGERLERTAISNVDANAAQREAAQNLGIALEEQITKIDEVIRAKREQQGIEDGLAQSFDAQVQQLLKRQKLEQELATGNPNPDPDAAPTDDVEKHAQAVQDLTRDQQIQAAGLDSLKTAYQDLYRTQDAVLALTQALAEPGLPDATRAQALKLLRTYQDQEKALQMQVDRLEDLEDKFNHLAVMGSLKGVGVGGQETLGIFSPNRLEALQGQIEGFTSRLERLQNMRDAGILTDEAFLERQTEAARQFTERLSGVYDMLTALSEGGVLPPEIEKVFSAAFRAAQEAASDADDQTDQLNKRLQRTTQIFGYLAQALRSLGDLGNVLGGMNQDLQGMISSTANVLGNLEQLGRVRASIDAGELTGSAATAAQAVPYIGMATSIASGLVSAFRGIFGSKEERERVEQEQIEAMQRLEDALNTNAEQVASAINRLLTSPVVGQKETGTEARQLKDAVDAYLETTANIKRQFEAGELTVPQAFVANTEALNAFFDAVAGLDIEGLDIEGLYQKLRDLGYNQFEALQMLIDGWSDIDGLVDFEGLGNAAQELASGIGGFSNTVEGAISAVDFFTQWIGTEAPEALGMFLDRLFDLPEDMLSPALRELLKDARGLDLTKAEDRAALQAIITQIATSLRAGGSDFLGGLTPEQLNAILETLTGFGLEDGEGTTRSTRVGRAITELQANEVVALLEEIWYILRSWYEYATGNTAPTAPRPDTGSGGDTGGDPVRGSGGRDGKGRTPISIGWADRDPSRGADGGRPGTTGKPGGPRRNPDDYVSVPRLSSESYSGIMGARLNASHANSLGLNINSISLRVDGRVPIDDPLIDEIALRIAGEIKQRLKGTTKFRG